MDSFKPLSRQQLAKFLPDDEAVRFFERLFRQAGQDVPSEITTLQDQVQAAFQEPATQDHPIDIQALLISEVSELKAIVFEMSKEIHELKQSTLL